MNENGNIGSDVTDGEEGDIRMSEIGTMSAIGKTEVIQHRQVIRTFPSILL